MNEVSLSKIEDIYIVRGHKVMMDFDLAALIYHFGISKNQYVLRHSFLSSCN